MYERFDYNILKMIYNPFISVVNQILPEPQASLLNGIIFGIKTKLPEYFYEALITSGTIHIVVLSGQNISLLTKIVSEFTLPLGRRLSIGISTLSIFIYVLFVGAQPPLTRAAIMASISLLSVYFGRQNWSLLSLFLAAGTMLLVNPGLINQISFQLSFLSTLGIILFGKIKQTKQSNWWQNFWQEIRISLRVTLAAQVFTLPVIFMYFKRVSLISPVSNLLIGWLIAPIMCLGFLACVLGIIYLPLGKLVALIVWVPLTFLKLVVEICARLPYASIKF